MQIDKQVEKQLNYLVNLFEKSWPSPIGLKKFDLLAICLLQKVFNNYAAAKLLLKHQLYHDAQSILRTAAEAFIYLVACVKEDEAFGVFYEIEGLKRRKKIFEKLEEYRKIAGSKESYNDPGIQEVYEELKKRKTSDELKKIAIRHELAVEYFYVHSDCSGPIHSLPHTMQSFLMDETGNVSEKIVRKPGSHYKTLITKELFDVVYRGMAFMNNKMPIIEDKLLDAVHKLLEDKSWEKLFGHGVQDDQEGPK